jgi:hypothetical protein
VRDNDGGNCAALKQRLVELCDEGGRAEALIRIACQELEAWYLGEPEALADAFGNDALRTLAQKARFRVPDDVANPAAALRELVPEFQKVSGARLMARHLTRERNQSQSFRALLDGIERLFTIADRGR